MRALRPAFHAKSGRARNMRQARAGTSSGT